MSEQINNALISGVVSLCVSVITFTLGLKAGKNQSDRQRVKDKYRNISVHLNEFLYALQGSDPKKWTDFKKKQINISQSRYIPLLSEMKLNGESIELNKSIISRCEKIEIDLLGYSSKYYNKFNTIQEYIIDILPQYCTTIQKQAINSISTTKETIGIPQQMVSYGIIIIKSELEKTCEILKNKDKYAINFQGKMKDGQGAHYVTIFKDTLVNKTVDSFLIDVHNYFYNNDEEIRKLVQERSLLIKQTEKLIKRVNKRVREPFTFRETFFGGILDIFRI